MAVWDSAEQDEPPDRSLPAGASVETHGVSNSKNERVMRKKAPSKAAALKNNAAHTQDAEKRVPPPLKGNGSTVAPPSIANADVVGEAKKKVPPPRPPRPTLPGADQPPPG